MRTALLALLAVIVLVVAACGTVTEDRPHEHPVDVVNGAVPPNEATYAEKSEEEIARHATDPGMETVVIRTTRAPGTRAAIHMHEHGGTTCVIEGEMTLYLEGAEPARAPAGTCYFMPPGRVMTGVNTGDGTAVMHDIFTVPTGADTWRPVETGFIGKG